MGYLINNGMLQISGTISAAEVNALGSTPFVFSTPENFMPLAYAMTVSSGTTQPVFSSLLCIQTVTSTRIIFQGEDPGFTTFYMFFGYRIFPIGTPTYTQAYNIEIYANNYQLTPLNNLDPTPGDYIYKYNLIGTILQ